MKKTIIIGIGSILRGDDGIGPRVIEELEKQRLPESISLRSGEISGLDILKYFPGFERVIIVDAADMKTAPGTIKVFNSAQIKKSDFTGTHSTHGMTLLETLTLAEKLGMDPEILIVGIQPNNTTFRMGLSNRIEQKIPSLISKIKEAVELPC
jgi:hydrogenase maturation protease